jgi:hypothetical protein
MASFTTVEVRGEHGPKGHFVAASMLSRRCFVLVSRTVTSVAARVKGGGPVVKATGGNLVLGASRVAEFESLGCRAVRL